MMMMTDVVAVGTAIIGMGDEESGPLSYHRGSESLAQLRRLHVAHGGTQGHQHTTAPKKEKGGREGGRDAVCQTSKENHRELLGVWMNRGMTEDDVTHHREVKGGMWYLE